MRRALTDLRYLWATRHSSGLPWPRFQVMGRFNLHMLLLGHPPWTVVPLWQQVLTIPLRPYRYARMVRYVARVRAICCYSPTMYDDVA